MTNEEQKEKEKKLAQGPKGVLGPPGIPEEKKEEDYKNLHITAGSITTKDIEEKKEEVVNEIMTKKEAKKRYPHEFDQYEKAQQAIDCGALDNVSKINNTPEEKKEEVVDETIDFRKRLVKPHKKKSKKVTDKDLPRVIEDAHVMYNLCHTQIGPIPGSYAIHHSQIDDKHPLNFFVTADQEIVINPKIIRHTEVGINKVEGCVSYPYNPPIIVKRFNKIEVELSNLTPEGGIGPVFIKKLAGVNAQVYQHECDHAKAKYIYEDKNIQGGDTEDM